MGFWCIGPWRAAKRHHVPGTVQVSQARYMGLEMGCDAVQNDVEVAAPMLFAPVQSGCRPQSACGMISPKTTMDAVLATMAVSPPVSCTHASRRGQTREGERERRQGGDREGSPRACAVDNAGR